MAMLHAMLLAQPAKRASPLKGRQPAAVFFLVRLPPALAHLPLPLRPVALFVAAPDGCGR